MKPPPAQVTMRDEEVDVEYTIHAYRELTRPEAVFFVNRFRAGKKVKRGKRYRIMTTLGANE